MIADQPKGTLPDPEYQSHRSRRGIAGLSGLAWCVFCTAVIWIAQIGLEIRSRQVAVKAIERCGGTVSYDYQWTSSKAWIPDAVPPGQKWARDIFGEDFAANVVEVQLFAGAKSHPEEFTDAEAKCLASLTKVKWMVLTDTSITDSGLKYLAGLKNLERLDLERTKITEVGVKALHQSRRRHLFENEQIDSRTNRSSKVALVRWTMLDCGSVNGYRSIRKSCWKPFRAISSAG